MIRKTTLITISAIVLLACGGGSIAEPNNAEQIKAKIAEVANDVQVLIGEASCTTDEQCKAISMGNKACGGPSFYLPYSTASIDTDALGKLAIEHRELSRQYNQLLGMMSDCAFLTEPAVACVSQRCEIKQSTQSLVQ